jgi:putative sigma-54 modulation protein
MQTSVTFKKIDPSEHLSTYVSNKLDRFDKYLDNPASANVVLSVEKFRHTAEINIIGDRLNIIGKEETEDMYSSIDKVMDKLDIQIKKNREKVRNHKGQRRERINELSEENPLTNEEHNGQRIIVQPIEYKPMDAEEAVMQLELIKDNFLVFTNARTDTVNVLYRRKDGNLGLIQPNK